MDQNRPPRTNTQSESFKRWFEGSKLADSQGNPIVLFHGARPGVDISTFESRHESDGIYFTPDPLYAEGFTSELFTDEPKAGAMYPVYLSIKNPYIVEAEDGDDDWLSFIDRGLDRRDLLKQGYDGAILIEKSTGVIDQVQAYHQEQIKSATGNAGTFNPSVSDIRYARNDPRYMFAGPQAESSDLILLDKARQMEKDGKAASFIHHQTGWLKGVDGNWRFEISDHDAKLKIGIPDSVDDDALNRVYFHAEVETDQDRNLVKATLNKNEPGHLATWGHTPEDALKNLKHALIKRDYDGYRSIDQIKGQYMELGDILEHPRLFAAYPRLRDMQIYFDPTLSDMEKGEYDTAGGLIINPNQPEGEILSIILHEVQHAIQQGEGLARGGSPEERFTSRVKAILQDMDTEHRQKVDAWLASNIFTVHESQTASDMLTYGLMFDSAQRLRSYANRDRPSGVLRLIKNEMGWAYHDKIRENPELRRPFDELDRNWMSLPKRHRMAARNLFLREQCAEAADLLTKAIPTEIFTQFRKDPRQLKSMIKALEREASRAREKLTPLRELEKAERASRRLKEKHSYSTAFQIYQSLAGEIEARNTQARQHLTPEERRATPPERTADIRSEDAIVLFRTRGGLETQIPYKASSIRSPEYFRFPVLTHQRMTAEEVRYVCNSLMTGWKGKPPIEVVERLSELPVPLQKDIWKQRAAADVRAAFWNNTAFVVAPRMPNRDALEEILLHEIVGHFGLRKMLDHELAPTLNQVYNDYGQSELAREIQQAYFKGQSFQPANPEHRALVAEEMMAKLAESKEHRALTLWDRFDSHTREGLRRMGYQIRLTSTDLLHLLHGAERVVQHGGLSRPSEHDLRYRRAYHGSPHTFDRFSLDAIGTGEGGQAFGWGLYLAGNKAVAEYYQQTLARDTGFTYGKKTNLSRDELEELVKAEHGNRFLDNLITPAGIASRAMDDAFFGNHYNHYPEGSERHAMYAKLWEAISWDKNAGNLYEVDIPDDEDFLDWYKPLAEQPAGVLEKLAPALDLIRQQKPLFAHTIDKQTMDGQLLYTLLQQVQNTPHEASLYLSSLGIPGLRYLDRFSRQGDSESHNYVVWDESVVTIAAVNEEIRQANDEAMFKRAYHGTPHTIDRFTLDAIGSGEGSQGYGYGLYFAEQREVAEYYRHALAARTLETNSGTYTVDELVNLFGKGSKEAQVVEMLARGVPYERMKRIYPTLSEAVGTLSSQVWPASDQGNLYEVEIPDDDALLDRNAPLSRQPQAVKDALANIEFPLTASDSYQSMANLGLDPFAGGLINEPTGEDLQAALGRAVDQQIEQRAGPIWEMIKDDPNRLNYSISQLSSMYLNRLGIPGLRYRDAGSQLRDGNSTSNYVIWDDSVIEIQSEGRSDTRYSLAYHGSAHAFDAFSMSSIGTGQGAQVFGHGLYFASRKEVAEHYRDSAVQDKVAGVINGWYVTGASDEAKSLLKDMPMTDAIAYAKARQGKLRGLYDGVDEELEKIRRQGKADPKGHLYIAEVPDDDLLLDANAPLDQQPAEIQRVLGEIIDRIDVVKPYTTINGDQRWMLTIGNQQTSHATKASAIETYITAVDGRHLYLELSHKLDDSDKAASEHLLQMGIPGMRYQDRHTRKGIDKGQATYNYVIWDDAAIEMRALNDQAPDSQTPQTETAAFKAWFAGSKIVDENGEPLVAYHGTGADFTEFKVSESGSVGPGIYFTKDPRKAGEFAEFMAADDFDFDTFQVVETDAAANIIPAYLSIKNPAKASDMPLGREAEAAMEQGYDGLVFDDYIVAFRPEQIKSAIGNTGAFDPANPDIRFSRTGQTNPEAFRNWFGESKVVDENGEPLVVYHGTSADFSEFDIGRKGAHFGTKEQADHRIDGETDGQLMMPTYLSIKNPKRVKDTVAWGAQIRRAKADGHDGIVYLNRVEGVDAAAMEGYSSAELDRMTDQEFKRRFGGSDSWIAFRPEQIKSAIGNTGAFDPANPDIRYKRAPEFEAWFGDSQVTNADGAPMTVYHRTSSDFTAFTIQSDGPSGPALFFGEDPERLPQLHNRQTEGDQIMPVHLKVEAPLELDEFNLREMQERWAGGSKEFPFYVSETAANKLQEAGFDGIIVEDVYGNGDPREYIVFQPEQVKSATGNTGAFNPENPDIRYQRGREKESEAPYQAADYELAINLLEQEDTESLAMTLQEECGLDASGLTKENLVTVAHQQGIHLLLNKHYNELIDTAVARWTAGEDETQETAKTVAFWIERGAYGYDLQKVDPILREAKAREAMQFAMKPGATPANDSHIESQEERFQRFLLQELDFQESCALMAEVNTAGNEIDARKRLIHHRNEVEEIRACLAMLSAGMSVEEIRQNTQPQPEKVAPETTQTAILDLNQRLKLNRAHKELQRQSPKGTQNPTAPGSQR